MCFSYFLDFFSLSDTGFRSTSPSSIGINMDEPFVLDFSVTCTHQGSECTLVRDSGTHTLKLYTEIPDGTRSADLMRTVSTTCEFSTTCFLAQERIEGENGEIEIKIDGDDVWNTYEATNVRRYLH